MSPPPDQTALSIAPSGQTSRRRDLWAVAGIALLLTIQFVLGLQTASRLSVTHDEFWHMPVGVLNWQTGRFDFDVLNPPLTRLWCALPVVLTGGTLPHATALPAEREAAEREAGGPGDRFLRTYGTPIARYERFFVMARTMNLVLCVIAGALLAVWSWSAFGRVTACASALLWVSCPTILANASLVTPDMGLTLLFVATLYVLWKYVDCPAWPRAIVLGLMLGLAQGTKFTAVLLYPICLMIFLISCWQNGFRSTNWRRACAQAFAVVALSLFVLNLTYLFQGSFSSIGDYDFHSQTLARLRSWPDWLQRCPLPVPSDYVRGVDAQRAVMESEHPVFLDGAWSTTGFAWYYPWTLLYKLTLPLLILCLLSAVSVLRSGRERQRWILQLFFLLPPAALLAAASGSAMQLGVRYVLPAIPLLVLFGGQAARWLASENGRLRAVLVGVLLALAPFALRFHPHHLAYFNELAGGPVEGRWHLLDSNLDWGQSLGELAAELRQRHIDNVGLAYYGTLPPSAWGIHYHLPPSGIPQPGWYAVSVNYVMGRPHLVRQPDDTMRAIGLDEYGYFRFFTPVARIGYAIDLYHLQQSDIQRWYAAQRQRR